MNLFKNKKALSVGCLVLLSTLQVIIFTGVGQNNELKINILIDQLPDVIKLRVKSTDIIFIQVVFWHSYCNCKCITSARQRQDITILHMNVNYRPASLCNRKHIA